MSLFGYRKRKLQNRIDNLEMQLMQSKHQLSQWANLYNNLKKFEWFEINIGGGIIAHMNDEPIENTSLYGTRFCVPIDYIEMIFD